MGISGREPHVSEDGSALGSVTHLFSLARQGDATAFSPLWQLFFPRLVGLAQKRLAGRRMEGSDAEDAAQAALISFWRQLNTGEFLEDLRRDSLWNLLATFTVRKVSKQMRKDAAVKRGGGHVLSEADLAESQKLDDLMGSLSAQELDVHAAEFVESLPEDLQELAMFRLFGFTTKEVADRWDCTQRKIQRKLELIHLRWKKLAAEDQA